MTLLLSDQVSREFELILLIGLYRLQVSVMTMGLAAESPAGSHLSLVFCPFNPGACPCGGATDRRLPNHPCS